MIGYFLLIELVFGRRGISTAPGTDTAHFVINVPHRIRGFFQFKVMPRFPELFLGIVGYLEGNGIFGT